MKRILLLLISLCLCSSGWSTEVSFQDGASSYAGTRDNYMSKGNATTNYGSNSTIEIHKQSSTTESRSLIKFDLSSIPSNANIISSTMTLVTEDVSASVDSCSMWRCYRNWNETQATWNIYSTGNNWGTGGCDNTTSDRSSVATASCNMSSSPGAADKWTSSQLVTDIQNFVNGTWTNYGWVLTQPTTHSSVYHDYYSREYGTQGNRPKLTVTYTLPPSAVPISVILQNE